MALDLIQQGGDLSEEAGLPVELTRTGLFQIIGQPPSVITLFEAAVLHPEAPKAGQAVTISGATLYLEDRRFKMIDADKVAFTAVYRRRGDTSKPLVRFGTVLTGEQTQLDRFGNEITVEHKGVTQGGEVRFEAPRSFIEYGQVEETNAPGSITQEYAGKLNQEAWNGGDPGTWKCTGVEGVPVDETTDPKKYSMTYRFEYNADGWQPGVVFVDPETGKPPPGLLEGVGYKAVEVFALKDFQGKFPDGAGGGGG